LKNELTNSARRFKKKEIQVIQLICSEYNTREIADELGIGKRTVESYRAAILKKIHARNTAGVIIYAIKNGLFKVH
jgi:DNA-binding NarL/FixJ family response regulator